jgi:hypothetical protein
MANPSDRPPPQRGGYFAPGYSRGYGRDFGGARNQGFDGSWGQGYGASLDIGVELSWIDTLAEQRQGPHGGRGPQGWTRSDERIREAVSERLMHDPLIDARGIEVEVQDGVVTLRGEAAGAADPIHAERLVRQVSGVKDVRVELTVRDGPDTGLPQFPEDNTGVDRSPRGYPILPT